MSDKRETKARLESDGGWGQVGASTMARYMKPFRVGPHGKGRRKCHCGCGGWTTHTGLANGVALTSGCEWFIRRWIRDGDAAFMREVPHE